MEIGRPVVVSIGEILVEFVSHQVNCGLSQVVDYSGPYPSGAPAIFIDQAARMGASTQMIGGVGDDGFGRSVLDRLRADGVGTDGITINGDKTTGVAFVSYYDSGDRDFIFHLTDTASDCFALPSGLIDPANTFLHISAASFGNHLMREVIMTAMRDVLHAGGKISCDPNARPELLQDGGAREALDELMQCSTCLMPSTSDLKFLFPDLTEEAAIMRLAQSDADIVVIKRGDQGATIFGDGARYDFAGHDVTQIDPTGAGDCFCGTFIALLCQGESLQSAGLQANAAGALAVTRRGPMEGNSSPDEISTFLTRQANT